MEGGERRKGAGEGEAGAVGERGKHALIVTHICETSNARKRAQLKLFCRKVLEATLTHLSTLYPFEVSTYIQDRFKSLTSRDDLPTIPCSGGDAAASTAACP